MDSTRGITPAERAGCLRARSVMETFKGHSPKKKVSCGACDFYQKVNNEECITRFSMGSMSVLALTNIGLVRKTNEDRYLIKKLDNNTLLLAIADGLGGETAGDYAAEILRAGLNRIKNIPRNKEQQVLEQLIKDIDMAIYNEAEKHIDLEGMGSTVVCVILRNRFAYWVHVGDSRLYILRDRQVLQITEDQTFARFLLEEGEITTEQVPTHYSRHIMDQRVGCGICEPETGRLKIREKDVLILTTDGLHKSISHEKMISLLNADTDIETKAKSLVQAALDTGGNDNITFLIAYN